MRSPRHGTAHRFPSTFLQVQPDAITTLVVSSWIAETPIRQLAPASTAVQARGTCACEKPDLVLVDADLADEEAIGFAARLRNSVSRESRILLFSARTDDALLFRASVSPALDGVIWRSPDARGELLDAIAMVSRGEKFLSPRFVEAVRALERRNDAFFKILSEREISLLPHIGSGLDDVEIAGVVGLSASTVQTHRKRIMQKLGLHCVRELMCWTFRKGFLPQKHPGRERQAV